MPNRANDECIRTRKKYAEMPVQYPTAVLPKSTSDDLIESRQQTDLSSSTGCNSVLS
jgi:hypothetical protein